MNIAEYFQNTTGTGVLATGDDRGSVNLAVYARPYVIDDNTVRSFKNIQVNPSAAYLFLEKTGGYKGIRLYLNRIGEETNLEKIKEIKKQHKNRYSAEIEGKHLLYFKITEIRPIIGDK
jgi:hypothetical protein